MELYEFLAKLREEEEDSPLPDSIRDDHETALGEIHHALSGGTIPDPEDPRLFSNGKPTGATTDDSPHIRVYAWCLANLGFGPDLAGKPTDLSRAGKECRLSLPEVREAFGKLLKEGDLKIERNRGEDLWYLAPARW